MNKFERFVASVEQMRDLQKQYFKTRDRGILQQSKNAEREVDKAIKELNDNPKLWDEVEQR